MYNPKDIFTGNALFFMLNNADDLHIGSRDSRQLDLLYELDEKLPEYKTGDNETREE